MQSQQSFTKQFSFEFFPPKTDEGKQKLNTVRDKLATLDPKYFSVTYGAGGSTQQGTLETVLAVKKAGYDAAPHLSCIGSTREGIRDILNEYRSHDIRHVVALRGDLPSGMCDVGDFRYANELVAFIREETGDHFHIEVAAYPEFHPQAKSAQSDLDNFIRKMNAGADSAITQYFFNADAYFYFVEQCEKAGIDKPIVPGIMPITNYDKLARFSAMCGAEIPRWLSKRLIDYGDDTASLKAFGIEVISEMCEKLLDAGAPGLHFYCMNQAEPSMTIWQNLNLSSYQR